MTLVNCKVELKLRWTKHCVLSSAVNDNEIANADNANRTIFITKDKIICSSNNFISRRQPKTIKTS